MNKVEYTRRENGIINKFKELNKNLSSKNIKVSYSVYNNNSIAKNLENNEMFIKNCANVIINRVHTFDSKYLVDEVVKSSGIVKNVTLEENFTINISDLEDGTISELTEYFGNMNNHEEEGFGNNKKYQIKYKGQNANGQGVEITAKYGKENLYNVRTSVTQIAKDGTIQKVYSDKKYDSYGNQTTKQTQGMSFLTPTTYSEVTENTNSNGEKVYNLKSFGDNKCEYRISSKCEDFSKANDVIYGGLYNKYSEKNGQIVEAKGKLQCRIDMKTGNVVKPEFKGTTSVKDAEIKANDYYTKYKKSPVVKYDGYKNKLIIEGSDSNLSNLNLNKVVESAKNVFSINDNFGIELREKDIKKYTLKK